MLMDPAILVEDDNPSIQLRKLLIVGPCRHCLVLCYTLFVTTISFAMHVVYTKGHHL